MPKDLRGLDVLDLGCGFGWYSRWFVEHEGAASARGIDISENMLARAREMTPRAGEQGITFDRADLDTVELPAAGYDVVFSALTLHYVSGLERLFGEVHKSLRPGGTFAFSVEHPMLTAPRRQGFVVGGDGARCWPLDDYHDEGERVTEWLGFSGAGGVRKQHRATATYVNLLLRAGFDVRGFEDWHPELTEEFRRASRASKWIHTYFLLISAVKR